MAMLARELGVSEDTIRRWRGHQSVEDRAPTPRTGCQPPSLWLRRRWLRPAPDSGAAPDDRWVVTREFIGPEATRSGLHRLLQRRGGSRLPAPPKTPTEPKPFRRYAAGSLPLDVKFLTQRADEPPRL